MSFPDDVGECRVCGRPTWYYADTCDACTLPRDGKGRFMKRVPDTSYQDGYDLYVAEAKTRRERREAQERDDQP